MLSLWRRHSASHAPCVFTAALLSPMPSARVRSSCLMRRDGSMSDELTFSKSERLLRRQARARER